MDYEKAYLEALDRAKAGKSMNEVFPELKENEDERIRNEIMEAVEELLPYERVEEIRFYLEKQKEQKPVDDKAFEEWIDDWWKHNKVNNPDSYDKGDEIQFDERGFKNFCRGIRNMYQPKQEWSEEDKHRLEQAINVLSRNGYYVLVDWLQLLPERFNIQSKQEWSEEDELMRTVIIQTLEKFGGRGTTGMQIDWLKSLRSQPKQKWSQEDNDFADDAIACVARCHEKYIDNKEFYQSLRHNTMDIKRWLIKVRKRLTPQWKPSKEQMEALRRATYMMGNSCFGKSAANDENLHSLYVALKKLM